MTSRTITLFSDTRTTPQAPTSFVVSLLVHTAAISFLSLGFLHPPQIENRALAERYVVRHLDLRAKQQEAQSKPHETIESPLQAQAETKGDSKTALPRRETARSISGAGAAQQVLFQPNAPLALELKEEMPIPNLVLWMPGRKTPANIVPPPRQKLSVAELSPSLQAPNEELSLSDLGVSSTDLAPQKETVAGGTTSPLVVHGAGRAQPASQTVTQSTAQPTPAAVVSLSQLHMNEGLITLPEINNGSGKHDSVTPGSNAPAGAANPSAEPSGKAEVGINPANSGNGGAAAKIAASGAVGAGTEKDGSVAHIDLPKDGQFGAVVVGSSLEEKYPETAELWTGRMAYTVYLHVGLPKSWILQYSLPRSAEAAAGGNIARIEAPWPYNIVRPNLAPGAINADALMVHGYVNQTGRFEDLAVAFPPEFAQSRFVLAALAQWQFRPAKQNGQNARVEVLVIIPEVP